jgi:hypothetical protein
LAKHAHSSDLQSLELLLYARLERYVVKHATKISSSLSARTSICRFFSVYDYVDSLSVRNKAIGQFSFGPISPFIQQNNIPKEIKRIRPNCSEITSSNMPKIISGISRHVYPEPQIVDLEPMKVF